MSVLGVTKWYKKQEELSMRNPEFLVLGRYPLAFVQELREAVGDSDFFLCNITRDFWFHNRVPTDTQAFAAYILNHGEVRGSLLPFAPSESRLGTRMAMYSPFVYDRKQVHPSLQTWNIKQDGGVELVSAWILASTWGPRKYDIDKVSISDFHMCATRIELVASEQSLYEWMMSQNYTCYAVGVSWTEFGSGTNLTCRIEGLLLRDLGSVEAGRNALIKIGSFRTRTLECKDYGFQSSETVMWNVI